MTDTDLMLKNRLGALRRERGLTQQQLADRSGVKIVTIQKLENGTNRVLGAQTETILRLTAALNTTMDELLKDVL